LDGLDLGHPVFSHGAHWLDARRAVGRAGHVAWDLTLTAGPTTHHLFPWSLSRTGFARRLYRPVDADLGVVGTPQVDDTRRTVEGRGVLGHLYGPNNATVEWTWAHASAFDEEQAVFECLAGRLQLGPVTSPLMTSAVLHLDGRTWRFNHSRDLLRGQATFGDG